MRSLTKIKQYGSPKLINDFKDKLLKIKASHE